jgi:serine/threonine-protein kinase PpkA
VGGYATLIYGSISFWKNFFYLKEEEMKVVKQCVGLCVMFVVIFWSVQNLYLSVQQGTDEQSKKSEQPASPISEFSQKIGEAEAAQQGTDEQGRKSEEPVSSDSEPSQKIAEEKKADQNVFAQQGTDEQGKKSVPTVSAGSESSQKSGEEKKTDAADSAKEKKKTTLIPVKIPGKTLLPLRILARPLSNIYKGPDEKSGIVEENVPVFQSYYVYTRPDIKIDKTNPQGWYEVGTDNRGTIKGWMKAEDVLEWKQTMCLAYKHPTGRQPVLMFSDRNPLLDMVKSPSEDRVKKAKEYYQQIESKNIPEDFPIISMEPKQAVDITEQFYLLPILEHAPVDIENREGRILKMASAPKEGRGESGTLKNNPEGISANPESVALKKLQMNVVYVVDMTQSMYPYIKATLDAIKDMTLSITEDKSIEKSIRFGFWGYRDSMEIPGIEFTTNNFTPELLEVGNFVKVLSEVEEKQKVFNIGSMDYPEDVFSGLDKAMRETKWTNEALHILILLGDAPSHEPGHKWNLSGQNANTLRTFASDNKFSILAVHIKDKDPAAQEYWDLAERQFKILSENRGVEGKPSYLPVQSDKPDEFAQASKYIATELINIVKEAKDGRVAQSPQASSETDTVKSVVRNMGYAALVDWIGRKTGIKAPRDIIAWVTDKDLVDPTIQSLDVKILINKKEIDSLKTVLQEIMTAGRKGEIGGEKFLTALQMIPSAASRGGEHIKNAISLADSKLLPDFMFDLPYNSQIMGMTNDLWASWSPDQQGSFLNDIDAKLKLYAAIHDNPKGWVKLHKGDDPDEFVYPLSLDSLP